jgi:glycine oxidase
MKSADVIVLGGGIIGCAVAEELAHRGRRVVLVERGTIGAEASSAAAGILAAQMDLAEPGPLFELCQAARRMYPRWVAHLQRRSGVSVGYRVCGILYLAMAGREEQAMERRARWQRRLGVRIERWSPKVVRQHEPSVDGRITCGFLFPTEAQVDNVRLMQALAVACRKAGVVLCEQTAVRRLLVRAHRVHGVQTDRGKVTSSIIVNCLGSWASMGGKFPIPLPVEPARGQILAFHAPRRLLRHAVMSEHAYAVQHWDGRLLVGSTVEFAGFEKAVTLEGMHGILSGVRQMSSVLNQCTFLEAWAGFRPYSHTGRPLIGPTSIEGLYLATGHFRHGILLAPITARLMAELILRGCTSSGLAPFSPLRFSK